MLLHHVGIKFFDYRQQNFAVQGTKKLFSIFKEVWIIPRVDIAWDFLFFFWGNLNQEQSAAIRTLKEYRRYAGSHLDDVIKKKNNFPKPGKKTRKKTSNKTIKFYLILIHVSKKVNLYAFFFPLS